MKNNISLGQHWLKNRLILDEIAEFSEVDGVKLCVEIGPGLGTLTSSLLKRYEKVLAIEYDQRLAANLPKSFPGKNLEVVNTDVLKFDFSTISEKYVIAGNIPYYITSPIIEKVLTAPKLAEKVVLLIQREVAERVVDDKETVLSLFVKNRADAEAGPVVLKDEFTPPPKVDSRILILKPHKPIVDDEVFKIISVGFKSPRKKLISNLSGLKPKSDLEVIFAKLLIDLDSRPGDIHLDGWQKIYNAIHDK